MSAAPIASQPLASDAQAAAQRVAQLQALIEQARGPGAAAAGAGSGPASFADTLRAASASAAPAASGETGSGYEALVQQAAARNGIDPAVLHGLIQQESGFDPNSTSSAGAEGLTQLMPETAASLGVGDPLDPEQSVEGGARYLSQMLAQFGGNTSEALAAYNAGPGAVRQYGGVPPYPETQDYVEKVLAYAQAYRQAHPTAPGAYPA